LLFNSFHYVAFFLLLTIACDLIRHGKSQQILLLFASYYFYWISSSFYLLGLIFLSWLNFSCSRALYSELNPLRKKRILVMCLLGNLGMLGFFKYANFALHNLNLAFRALQIDVELGPLAVVLPIGISFYTFQGMSYTLDIYMGRFKPISSFKTLALYVAFFPQLVAGPIVRAAVLIPQLERRIQVKWDNFKMGVTLILYGLIKKICIADNLAGVVSQTFQQGLTQDTMLIFFGILAFAIQIYCDFSGYTDIAIGSARVLGLSFPDNFAHPYWSRNISEFWQRWHISLSTWLRDYLYIPLGGNRRGKPRQMIYLMITMTLGGLWHGAAWHFVLWGAYHGMLLVVHKGAIQPLNLLKHRFWTPLKILFTLYLTCIGWLIFIIPDLDALGFYLKKMLLWEYSTSGLVNLANLHPLGVWLVPAFWIVHLISHHAGNLALVIGRLRSFSVWMAAIGVGLVLLYLLAGGQRSFIYFQF